MSVFSKIMMSKKAAKAHKAKVAEKESDAPVKEAYKHVPTHAAVDALSGAPASWNQDDRPKIREQHKRRSQMGSRATSTNTLSTASYLNSAAGPSNGAPALPRNSSYNSYNPTWFDRGGDVYHAQEPAQKRYKPSRGHSYHDSGIGPSVGPSPLASNMHSEDASPAISSGNSSTSDSDHLEISAAPNPNYHITKRPDSIRASSYNSNRLSRPQPIVYGDKDIFLRLHTSTTRKLGEAPLYDSPPLLTKAPVAKVVAQEKPKKQRWSLLGKRNSANVVA